MQESRTLKILQGKTQCELKANTVTKWMGKDNTSLIQFTETHKNEVYPFSIVPLCKRDYTAYDLVVL